MRIITEKPVLVNVEDVALLGLRAACKFLGTRTHVDYVSAGLSNAEASSLYDFFDELGDALDDAGAQ